MRRLASLILLLAALLPSAALAHGASTTTQAGPYTIEFSTLPEQLEPGSNVLILSVAQEDGTAFAREPIWVRLSEGKHVVLATTLETDGLGVATLSYRFGGPGLYTLDVSVEGNRASVPVHVHGQYLLLFGFLAAVFIVLALLLERL